MYNPIKEIHQAQFHLIKAIRTFFENDGFMDVMTPPMVPNPGMETHIHPFQVASAYGGKLHDLYLHTSPEFCMKELLAEGLENIFTICYCFRDEPSAPHHRNEFLMLEWYRSHATYLEIMDDTENLLRYCYDYLKTKNVPVKQSFETTPFVRMTVSEVFKKYLNFDILDFMDREALYQKIKSDFKHVPLPGSIEGLSWDDLYFLLFLNEIEPHFTEYPYLLLYEFPAPLAALSTLKESDPRVCERFEVYLNGVELCNCFNELRDIKVQRERFKEQRIEKKNLYHYELPEPTVLYDAVEKGFPKTGGIALGVERLLMALTEYESGFYH